MSLGYERQEERLAEDEAGKALRRSALGAIARLQPSFPEVGFSLEAAGDDFLAEARFWSEQGVGLEAGLAYQDRFAEGMDDKIRAAHLIAFYGNQLALALGSLYLGAGIVVAVQGLRFEAFSRSYGERVVAAKRFHFSLALPAAGEHALANADVFGETFAAHVAPIIATLKRRTGLSSGAQWRLAADSLAGGFLEIGRALGDEVTAMSRALAIVKREGTPLFSDKLCYENIAVEIGESAAHRALSRIYRLRGGCCLYYRTEGGSFCDSCVLLAPDDRRARLQAHLLASQLR
ncbi:MULTISPECIES: (2Fe-2S)-binding protein [unclassified Ensifer]|uniref:(2Fe-2S)-binding protein n=1 Tax=unclassified Ensifer TaxID=2633371 RepID=UPI0009F1F53D|nr:MULTISPECIES: (2Fe-2S)-binding protein [unclassified Ensifer]